MKAKELRKRLKKVPDDVDVVILAYAYSQSRKDRFGIGQTIENIEEYQFIITIDE